MSYLDKIITAKKKEIKILKERIPLSFLEKSSLYDAERPSFYESLKRAGPSFIAEFKRRSPSKGMINKDADIIDIARGYQNAGASAISVLTDIHFEGRALDISVVFETVDIPILRKDFIIDKFQIYEARSAGASAILLIAAVLTKSEIEELSGTAESLGLDVLLELHDEEEIFKIPKNIKIAGINNRDLATFKVDTQKSMEMQEKLPSEIIKVSESGLSSVDTVINLYKKGFQAFLIGETFMKNDSPGLAAQEFIAEAKKNIARLETNKLMK
jgi:indole-3-glycerol phosphate synthase